MHFFLTNFGLFFWLYFIYFILSVSLAFFVPGDFFIKRIKISSFQRIVLGTIFGIVLWCWQGFIFGYLNQRWLSYLYILLFFILWLKNNYKEIKFKNNINFKNNTFLILIVLAGVFLQISTVWFNGVYIKEGLFFCCGNTNDNLFHLALINELVKNVPPYEPGMSDILVQNYHYWGNLAVADIVRVFKIPIVQIHSQYFSFLISLFLGLTAIVFSQILKIGKKFIYWFVFFLYFGGDLIFIVPLITRGKLDFSMSSLEDGSKFLTNFPRAFSIIIFLGGISLLVLWIKRKNNYIGILTSITLGSLIGFKVYTGFFALFGLAFVGCYFLLKKDYYRTILIIFAVILSLIIYLPVNKNAGGLYFTSLWIFENFIVQQNLGLYRLELARLIYAAHNNIIRVFLNEVLYITIYLVAIFGTKLSGLFQNRTSLSFFPLELNIFLISGIIISSILGLFFRQTSGGSNTFNFLVSVFIIGSIYSALACFYWSSRIKGKKRIVFIAIIVTLTIPRIIDEGFLNIKRIVRKDGYIIYNDEIQSLKYIKDKTNKNSLIFVDHRTMPLMVDAETPYISFLTDRPMFLSGMNTELAGHGIDFSKREKEVENILGSTNPVFLGSILLKNNINYIIMSSKDTISNTESEYFLKQVFQGPKIQIFEVSGDKIKDLLKRT